MHINGPILIIDDDLKTASLLACFLEHAGFASRLAPSAKQALELIAECRPLAAILDTALPDDDGWSLCSRIRDVSDIPIVMLTRRDTVEDRVRGLTLGADDYVVKPCSCQELVARIKAILRRTGDQRHAGAIAAGPLAIDMERHEATLEGERLALTESELRLLHTLSREPGRVFARSELVARLYPGGGVVVDRAIDVHITNLRQKLREDPKNPRFITTVRGAGYAFAQLDAHEAPLSPAPAQKPAITDARKDRRSTG